MGKIGDQNSSKTIASNTSLNYPTFIFLFFSKGFMYLTPTKYNTSLYYKRGDKSTLII